MCSDQHRDPFGQVWLSEIKDISGIIILNFVPLRSDYKDVRLAPVLPKCQLCMAGSRLLKV